MVEAQLGRRLAGAREQVRRAGVVALDACLRRLEGERLVSEYARRVRSQPRTRSSSSWA